ncbi:MAG: non-canonical purine NTP pyrophosphatase, partial [Conexivisphaerales archaeon]
IKLEQCELLKPEIQDDNIENIALNAAVQISTKINNFFVVEDDGLFLNEFKGFPGPYTSYAFKTIGIPGILKLCSFCTTRRAQFRSALALYMDGKIKVFNGAVSGIISATPLGNMGFGFDPIFIPDTSDKTFAQMSLKEKSQISHRAVAFRTMANYLANYYRSTTNP